MYVRVLLLTHGSVGQQSVSCGDAHLSAQILDPGRRIHAREEKEQDRS